MKPNFYIPFFMGRGNRQRTTELPKAKIAQPRRPKTFEAGPSSGSAMPEGPAPQPEFLITDCAWQVSMQNQVGNNASFYTFDSRHEP